MRLRILHWNVLFSEDIKKVQNFIEKVDPDICGLQELTVDSPQFNQGINTPEFLGKELVMHHYFELAQGYESANSLNLGNAILSKIRPRSTRKVFVKDPTEAAPAPETEGRVYIEATFEFNDAQLVFGTTHLSYVPFFEEKDWKRQEWDRLHQAIGDQPQNYIFSGDLNAKPDGLLVAELSEKLVNAGPDFSQKTFTTKPFENDGFKVDGLEYRLDYIFSSPDIHVLSCEVLKTDVSDHLPLLLEIEI